VRHPLSQAEGLLTVLQALAGVALHEPLMAQPGAAKYPLVQASQEGQGPVLLRIVQGHRLLQVQVSLGEIA
jgi:hypothetical protein